MHDVKATREDWKAQIDTPAHLTSSPMDRKYTKEEYKEITLGFIPQVMEDKWFIFSEDDWLYFFRSWSGQFFGKVRFEEMDEHFITAEAWVAPFKDQDGNDEVEPKILEYLIDRLLLGRDVPLKSTGTIIYHSHYGRGRSRREPVINPFIINTVEEPEEDGSDHTDK